MTRFHPRAAGLPVAVAVAAALLACSGAAHASTPGRPLAAAGTDSTDVQVFWRDGSGNLMDAVETGGSWAPAAQSPITGLASDPTAIRDGSGDDVFYEGANQDLWKVTYTNGVWGTPGDTGIGPLASDPTVTTFSTYPGVTDTIVGFQGPDGGFWDGQYLSSTGQWAGPYKPAWGTITSAPAGMSYGNSASGGQVLFFWGSAGGDLGEGWGTWPGNNGTEADGGPADDKVEVGGPPTAVVSYTQLAYWEGLNGDLGEAELGSNNVWSEQNVGFGPMESAPTAVALSSGVSNVFWEAGGDLWEATNDDGTWSALQSVDSLTPPAPVQSTPQPVSISTAPSTPSGSGSSGSNSKKKKPALHVKITFRATWNLNRTRIRDLKFSKLPAHSGVRITCSGTKCPKNLGLTTAKYKLATLVRHFDSDTFAVGQKITITVGHTGYTAQKVRLTIRRGAEPAARLL